MVYTSYMELSTFEIEKELSGQGFTHIIGTDEVGRGPLCGPVVAAAVMFRGAGFPELNSESELSSDLLKSWNLVRDSKKVSEKQREEIFDFIHEHFHVGIGLCDHETIDRINILEASFLAMKKAIQSLLRASNDQFPMTNFQSISNDKISNFQKKSKIIILVDGNKVIPNFSHEQKAIVGGDKLVKSISAASIIAKVTRDRMMMQMHEKYPQYGFDRHKGYGTKMHMKALIKHGPCEIHRQSFRPVREATLRKFTAID